MRAASRGAPVSVQVSALPSQPLRCPRPESLPLGPAWPLPESGSAPIPDASRPEVHISGLPSSWSLFHKDQLHMAGLCLRDKRGTNTDFVKKDSPGLSSHFMHHNAGGPNNPPINTGRCPHRRPCSAGPGCDLKTCTAPSLPGGADAVGTGHLQPLSYSVTSRQFSNSIRAWGGGAGEGGSFLTASLSSAGSRGHGTVPTPTT